MVFRPSILLLQLVIGPMLASITLASSSALVVSLQQNGSVLLTRNAVVVEQDSSSELTPLNFQAGNTFNEANLDINYPPTSAPNQGLDGQIYVSSSTMAPDQADRLSQVLFNYDFQLLSPTDYFIRYTKQGDATTSFSVANETGVLISFSETQDLVLNGRFEPGEYSFSIEASAFTPLLGNGILEQDFSQLDFALFLTPVPEPGTVTLATGFLFALLASGGRVRVR